MTKGLESHERELLVDSVHRYGATQPFNDHHAQRWKAIAEMGWLALVTPEELGGIGGNLYDAATMAEAMGFTFTNIPFLPCGLEVSLFLQAFDTERYLTTHHTGEQTWAVAAYERGHIGMITATGLVASPHAKAWLISGSRAIVPGANEADGLFVLATIEHTTKTGVFLISTQQKNTCLEAVSLYDGRQAARVSFNQATATLLCMYEEEEAINRLQHIHNQWQILRCAETIGVAKKTFDYTHNYVMTRKQFRRAISDNQTIQHRLVDLYIQLEEARSLWRHAAQQTLPEITAALLIQTSDLANAMWQEAIQLHGAIGMTEEYEIGRYVRRLAIARTLYGSQEMHVRSLADLALPYA